MKIIKKIVKIFGFIIAAILLIFLIGSIIQKICCNYEKAKISG